MNTCTDLPEYGLTGHGDFYHVFQSPIVDSPPGQAKIYGLLFVSRLPAAPEKLIGTKDKTAKLHKLCDASVDLTGWS
jgi:hypothetical protein